MFDPPTRLWLTDMTITVCRQTGLIISSRKRDSPSISELGPRDVDLRHLFVLPGLVDAHTHLFLHAEAETSIDNQMAHESPTERTIRATTHAQRALLAGYTTYRDLGSEGMGDADVGLRNAINRGLVPGPRCYVATEPIASSSGYALRHENSLNKFARLADEGDGPWALRAAVRRRLGAGADVIKVYADAEEKRTLRFPEASWQGAASLEFPPEEEKPRNYLLFTLEELKAIVDEAHRAECPVAVHAISAAGIRMAAEAEADTIEHGSMADDDALKSMREYGAIYVPTLSVMEVYVPPEPFAEEVMPIVKRALELGIQFAVGSDAGPAPHGENARELELMVKAGIPLDIVLEAATLGGWRACGGAKCGRKFGWWGHGNAADLIGLAQDPRQDIGALRKVDFVMKDARVWKQDGVAVGMT